VRISTLVVGSTAALRTALDDESLVRLPPSADVVIVPTAAAFIGAPQAALKVAQLFDGRDVRAEALMITDRESNTDGYFVDRLSACDLVVLCDGSALHAKAVWRNSPVGDAIKTAGSLVAIGSVATALGEIMIDPRGGAPTVGLNYRPGAAFISGASDEQLARTRSLLDRGVPLVVLGPDGVLEYRDGIWRVVRSDGVVVTRGDEVVTL